MIALSTTHSSALVETVSTRAEVAVEIVAETAPDLEDGLDPAEAAAPETPGP